MGVKKYTDWASYWDGLRTNLFKCIGTTGVAYLGTNAIAGATKDAAYGISWNQALSFFGVHLAFEVFNYLKNNQPQVITETVDTSFSSKNPVTGAEVVQSSTKTTVTPVADAPKTP
jgi:hypothetical protein